LIEEFCAADPKRLYGQSILPVWDIELAKDEAMRTVKMGHRAIVWNGMMDTTGFKPTWDTHWDPLYTTLEDLGVPISIHLGGTGWGLMGIRPQANATSVLGKDVNPAVPAFVSTSLNIAGVLGNMYPLIEVLMSGMLERLPRLKIYLAEGGASWAPFVLRMCDYYWQRYSALDRNNLRMLPSDYARRQVYYGTFLDVITPEVAKIVGGDKIMWEADYNHTVSTFPNSRKYQEESLAPITDQELRAKILAGNAVKLFRIGA
jgi:predicted TIM-barrel fold metal-dependent hydrolase